MIADNEKSIELVQPRIKRKGVIGRPKGSKNKNRRDEENSDNEKVYSHTQFTPKSDNALRFRKSSEVNDSNYTHTLSERASPKHIHISEGNLKD